MLSCLPYALRFFCAEHFYEVAQTGVDHLRHEGSGVCSCAGTQGVCFQNGHSLATLGQQIRREEAGQAAPNDSDVGRYITLDFGVCLLPASDPGWFAGDLHLRSMNITV